MRDVLNDHGRLETVLLSRIVLTYDSARFTDSRKLDSTSSDELGMGFAQNDGLGDDSDISELDGENSTSDQLNLVDLGIGEVKVSKVCMAFTGHFGLVESTQSRADAAD